MARDLSWLSHHLLAVSHCGKLEGDKQSMLKVAIGAIPGAHGRRRIMHLASASCCRVQAASNEDDTYIYGSKATRQSPPNNSGVCVARYHLIYKSLGSLSAQASAFLNVEPHSTVSSPEVTFECRLGLTRASVSCGTEPSSTALRGHGEWFATSM